MHMFGHAIGKLCFFNNMAFILNGLRNTMGTELYRELLNRTRVHDDTIEDSWDLDSS